jgi:hypothetical protein
MLSRRASNQDVGKPLDSGQRMPTPHASRWDAARPVHRRRRLIGSGLPSLRPVMPETRPRGGAHIGAGRWRSARVFDTVVKSLFTV